ncbi:DUF4232 domain-containing protein [Streptomyces sp. NPDC048664]|uniref:DUF4232 domain-containing protein n=1 Tax=Streptomyces sp. NPDC048664 TaxID=3154505 RepID=UPI00342B1219
MRVHKLTFAALAVAAGLSLTACQSNDPSPSTGQSAPSSAPAGSSLDGGPGSGGSAQGGGAQGSAGTNSGAQNTAGKSSGAQGTAAGAGTGSGKSSGTAGCHTDQLQITAMDNTIGGDTDRSVAVTLKNRGGGTCSLSGYAGVDLKTSAGSLSAKRTGEKGGSAVLRPGQSVSFGITYPNNTSGGSGVRVTGLLVTPPNETRTVSLAWPGAATLPVTDGSGSPVKVGPIGSAGQGG